MPSDVQEPGPGEGDLQERYPLEILWSLLDEAFGAPRLGGGHEVTPDDQMVASGDPHKTVLSGIRESAANELSPTSQMRDVVDELGVSALIRHEVNQRIVGPVRRIDAGE